MNSLRYAYPYEFKTIPNAFPQLLVNDMSVTIALCDACPSTEVDELTISLLNIFDSRGLGFGLLKALIEHEVEETGMLCSLCMVNLTTDSSCRKRSRTSSQKLCDD
jgi:hypothetical protein